MVRTGPNRSEARQLRRKSGCQGPRPCSPWGAPAPSMNAHIRLHIARPPTWEDRGRGGPGRRTFSSFPREALLQQAFYSLVNPYFSP